MATKYKLIRDKKIINYDESRIEVCDDRQEIVNYSVKELLNLIIELQESDCRDIEIFADIFEIVSMLAEISYIELDGIDDLVDWKIEHEGEFSKYLLKIGD